MGLNIFFMGITGYLGGSLFARLHPDQNHHISALVRSQEKADWLRAHGIRPVLGDLSATDLIEEEALKADVFINTADSDHLPSAKAAVLGLKKRYEKTGQKSLYLHTSGTGILIEKSDGTSSPKVWLDTDTSALNAIPETALHRKTDMWLLDNSSNVDLCMVCPPSIYGRGVGEPALSNIYSVQIPFIIAHAVRNGRTQQIGPGKNVSSQIHVADLVQLYLKLLRIYLEGGDLPTGYLFPVPENGGEHVMGDLVNAIARELKKQGILETDEVVTVEATDAELKRVFTTVAGKYLVGSNCRARGPKALSTGWAATEKEDIYSTIPHAVKEISQAVRDGTKSHVEEAKVEEAKAEEAKVEEAKAEEAKVEEAKAEEAKVEGAKVEEAKIEEVKIEEAEIEEGKIEEAKLGEAKIEEAKSEEAKSEEGQE
ncbi:NAD(P)-binding protein [Lepidopterella palustris CBS 459.81]|uniref:NAD(P)-binding protein n=1 Tax=Lepidopterella palustris CBS 459.81 TaxID=1314670 RepID=A0A8E2DZM9_9PEZI|nr:NAD(P)-binding protein [Lepidopterella palustris CBS 459.81]